MGTGSGQPQGVITGVSAVANSVIAAKNTGNVYAADDVYASSGALPPRYRPNASWVANEAILLLTRQFASGTGPQHAFWADFGMATPSQLLGRPLYESSAMDSTLADGKKIADVGDIKTTYMIVDRVGMTIQFNPMVVGSNRRPTDEVWLVREVARGRGLPERGRVPRPEDRSSPDQPRTADRRPTPSGAPVCASPGTGVIGMTVRAKQTIHYAGPDGTLTLGGGQEFPNDDELVSAHPEWFETVSEDYEPPQEKKAPARKAPAKKTATDKKDEDSVLIVKIGSAYHNLGQYVRVLIAGSGDHLDTVRGEGQRHSGRDIGRVPITGCRSGRARHCDGRCRLRDGAGPVTNVGAAISVKTGQTNLQAIAAFETLTGRPLPVRRTYDGAPAADITLSSARFDLGVRKSILSIKPTASTPTATIESLAESIAAAGHECDVIIRHEPVDDADLTPDGFIELYQRLAPAFRAAGVPVGVCYTNWSSSRLLAANPQSALDHWWPGSGIVDFIAIDEYPIGEITSTKDAVPMSDRMRRVTQFADREGIPLSLTEFGVDGTWDVIKSATWVRSVTDWALERAASGRPLRDVCYFHSAQAGSYWLDNHAENVAAYTDMAALL